MAGNDSIVLTLVLTVCVCVCVRERKRENYSYRWHHQCRENPSLEWFILLVAFQKCSTWSPKEKVLAVRWWRWAFQHLNTQTNTRTCPHTPVQVGFLSCFIWSLVRSTRSHHNNRSKRSHCLSQAFMRPFKNTVSMCEKEVFMTAVQTLHSKDRCTDEHTWKWPFSQ